ncbi:MAG: hypothetical protein WAV31_05020 [Candidatus Moraniibacteriota bacterium]
MLNNPLIWWNFVLILGALDRLIVDSQFSEDFDFNDKSIHAKIVRINWRCSHLVVFFAVAFALIVSVLWIFNDPIFPETSFNIYGYSIILAGYLSAIHMGRGYAVASVAKGLGKYLDEKVLRDIEEVMRKERLDAWRSIQSNNSAGFPGDNGKHYEKIKGIEKITRLIIEIKKRKEEEENYAFLL